MANPARRLDSDPDLFPPGGWRGERRRGIPASRLAGSRSGPDVVGVTEAMSQTDDALLDAVRAGDVGAFDTLCLAYATRLWRFSYSIVGSREGAQDVVQDVLLNVWERRATITLSGSLTAYLFGACRRRALYYLRNNRTAERIGQQWTADDVPGMARASDGPHRALERDETRRLLDQAIAQLPEARRQVIALRWDQQLDYDDIAHVMQITPDAARAHVSRAYRVLRTLLRAAGVEFP